MQVANTCFGAWGLRAFGFKVCLGARSRIVPVKASKKHGMKTTHYNGANKVDA